MLSGEDGQGRITVASKFYEAIFVLSFGKTYGVAHVYFKSFGLIRKSSGESSENDTSLENMTCEAGRRGAV